MSEEKQYRASVCKAAEKGDPDSQFILGTLFHADGDKKAIYWYTKSAEQGHAAAQNNLGVIYTNLAKFELRFNAGFKDLRIETDFKKAVYWITKAAKQDHALAQCILGLLFRKGKGVKQDDKQAAHWYIKAAELGNSWARQDIGLMYYHGFGVEKDIKLATYWLRRAGTREALQNIEVIGYRQQGLSSLPASYHFNHFMCRTRFPIFDKGQ